MLGAYFLCDFKGAKNQGVLVKVSKGLSKRLFTISDHTVLIMQSYTHLHTHNMHSPLVIARYIKFYILY